MLKQLSKDEEKAVIEEAVETLRLDREAELKGEPSDAGRKAQILCHTSYATDGHACVYIHVATANHSEGFGPLLN